MPHEIVPGRIPGMPILPTRSPVLPQGQPAQGGPRRKTQSELLFTNTDQVNAVRINSAGFIVRNPSVRLVCMLAVTFAPIASDDLTVPQTGAGAWLLTLDAWIRLSRDAGGRVTRANNIITSQPLPWAMNEPSQGVDEIRGTVVPPWLPGTGTDPSSVYVTATWEPAPGESSIPDDELQQMFGLATVLTYNGGVISEFGAG